MKNSLFVTWLAASTLIASFTAQATPLLLSDERLALIEAKQNANTEGWRYFISSVNDSIGKKPYNSGKFAASSALAFAVTGEQRYYDNALRLYQNVFLTTPNIGWKAYNDRNGFRTGGRWALLTFDWLKPAMPTDVRHEIEDTYAVWANFWLKHTDHMNDFKKLRLGDTDDVTSLADNLTLLGYTLAQSEKHQALGTQTLAVADRLFHEVILDRYMSNLMAGGVWAEGNDYSPQTQLHWVTNFLVNRENRDMTFETDYPLQSAKALRYMTLSGYSDVYRYGSGERVNNYSPIAADGRYNFVMGLYTLLSEEENAQWLLPWWQALMEKEGHVEGSIYTGIWRLLFEPLASDLNQLNVADEFLSPDETLYHAPGVGLVVARSGWEEDDSVLFMMNRRTRVDHEQRDALSLDFAYEGTWVTKEMTGYSGVSAQSIAHNTLLIENAEGGSSSPTGRAAGDPFYYAISDHPEVSVINAEAAPAYNMSGYFSTDYAEQVSRQVAFFKPGIVAVYDRVTTNPKRNRDLQRYKKNFSTDADGNYFRRVTLNQHLMGTPQRDYDAANALSYSSKDIDVHYAVAWPENAEVQLVDGKEKWADYPEYHSPKSQRNWMAQTRVKEQTADTEFVSFFAASSAPEIKQSEKCTKLGIGCIIQWNMLPAKAPEYEMLTEEKGNIVAGNAIGIAFDARDGDYVTIWNRNPNEPLEVVAFEVAKQGERLYTLSGLLPDQQYDVHFSSSKNLTTVQLNAAGDVDESSTENEQTLHTNAQGVLVFRR
ncbi:hypothetical protein [Alteromonas oceanisediminis]|uniref:hypothetical protein n=1 Tax=Alteromonas oceanisediminis TaxID=2836180 RepID=UPI001BDAEE36|nr:hypothetical protein [Alteromonas oceanisediminis]MBT0585669.1 hypothetical protein [Alteromonas oceanisediminis]